MLRKLKVYKSKSEGHLFVAVDYNDDDNKMIYLNTRGSLSSIYKSALSSFYSIAEHDLISIFGEKLHNTLMGLSLTDLLAIKGDLSIIRDSLTAEKNTSIPDDYILLFIGAHIHYRRVSDEQAAGITEEFRRHLIASFNDLLDNPDLELSIKLNAIQKMKDLLSEASFKSKESISSVISSDSNVVDN